MPQEAKSLSGFLFKKILLSMFPKEITTQGINPAGMFISFISAKQFFSLVNRKIVENYKLNLFDIALDPFEVKIGFGDKPAIKVKDIDFYYAYCAAANLNGYRFYNPSNIANIMSMVSSIYCKKHFTSKDGLYFAHMLFTIYLLTFIFFARIKIFPYTTKQENYNRFIDVFFSFYKVIFIKTQKTISEKKFASIKSNLLKEVELFFGLFYFYKNVNQTLEVQNLPEKELYTRLFYDELKKGQYQKILEDYVEHADTYAHTSSFGTTEKHIIDLLLPADILIRYVFNAEDVFDTANTVCTTVFDKTICDTYLQSFLQNEDKFEEFMQYILSFTNLKKHFFKGMQKFVLHKFRTNQEYDVQEEEEINEFLSAIGDADDPKDMHDIRQFQVPEKIRKESQAMEKLINFYITFVGGLSISRGDSMFVRLFRKDLIRDLMAQSEGIGDKDKSLYYYGGLLYSYSKNIFYYKYAYDNIKAGKDKFNLPFRATLKEVYSNMFIIRMFDENFIATILQDINPHDIKIYLKNKKIIQTFTRLASTRVSAYVRVSQEMCVQHVYTPIHNLLSPKMKFLQIVQKYINKEDYQRIKNRLYTVDFWIANDVFEQLLTIKKTVLQQYGDMSVLGILSIIKDTIFGLYLYMAYIQEQTASQTQVFEMHADALYKIYCTDILHIAEELVDLCIPVFKNVYIVYKDILQSRTHIDDNKEFLELGYENRQICSKNKTITEIMQDMTGEDIVWFKGFLKNITYYNKRYILPS